MKNVIVTLKGTGPVFWMEGINEGVDLDSIDLSNSFRELEEEEILDYNLNEPAIILEDVEVLYTENEDPVESVDDEGAVDVTSKKGKYIFVDNYFSDFLSLKCPIWAQQINMGEIISTFHIEMEHDEEFDPKKLQLIKSDYEVKFLPYGVVSSLIVYDGKCYKSDYGHGHEDKGYWDAFIYNDEQPYASSAKAVKIDVNNIIYPYDC
jgi:hypothetical protein